ncbi:helix-turn-helix domain-containing protein [Gordonia desulfuricans]|uniref:Helix-turn-helix domain-containing protein n=1 Tax=Gordonia desulfuricans TaxID=89051 RepID=A0A7K3LTB3_9ACTN|nr:helix-turn-helix domain-containing protein [Gordonia desulfuricans]NDK91524.1 helix-turn-helix domain-containing protein [Gordonia desulfuricans]
MTTLLDQTVLPDTDGGDAQQLDALLAVLAADQSVIVRAGEHSAELPEELRQILRTVLSNLTQGTAVTVEPHRTMLTTQEAADILGITRPTLVRLLTDNEIPFTTPGRHRRVQLTDVLAYQQRMRTQRAEALTELAAPDPDPTEAGGFITTR